MLTHSSHGFNDVIVISLLVNADRSGVESIIWWSSKSAFLCELLCRFSIVLIIRSLALSAVDWIHPEVWRWLYLEHLTIQNMSHFQWSFASVCSISIFQFQHCPLHWVFSTSVFLPPLNCPLFESRDAFDAFAWSRSQDRCCFKQNYLISFKLI